MMVGFNPFQQPVGYSPFVQYQQQQQQTVLTTRGTERNTTLAVATQNYLRTQRVATQQRY